MIKLRFPLFLLAGGMALLGGGACASSDWSARAAAPVVVVEEKPFPIPVIELSGTGEQIGKAHGEALKPAIRELHEKYLQPHFTSYTKRMMAMMAAKGFEGYLSPEHQAEVRGMAETTELPQADVMLAQCFLDLLPMTACSTVSFPADASPDGVARMGRNLDFPSMDVADKHSVVLVYRPAGKYALAVIGWPGMIGTLSGMNEHGLCLANMELKRGQRLPGAMPYTVLYRSVLESCRTVDEAVAYLKSTPRQSANNLMLIDASGNRAVVELTPEEVVVRTGEAGKALISTNHRRGEDQDTAGRCWRYDTLHRQSADAFGKIDEKAVERMLADVKQGTTTMQSMVFEPENRVVWLATGQEAPTKEFYRLDLRKRFGW